MHVKSVTAAAQPVSVKQLRTYACAWCKQHPSADTWRRELCKVVGSVCLPVEWSRRSASGRKRSQTEKDGNRTSSHSLWKMTTVWTKLRLRSCLEFFKQSSLYRSGIGVVGPFGAGDALSNSGELAKAVEQAVVPVKHLQVELLDGLPVDHTLSESQPDAYLMRNLRDLSS